MPIIAVVVSPCTSTRSGFSVSSIGGIAPIKVPVSPSSVWPGRITSRSTVGRMSKMVMTASAMARCCPVKPTRVSIPGVRSSSLITGAILMASGRVPKQYQNPHSEDLKIIGSWEHPIRA